MDLDDQIYVIREHARRRHGCDFAELERDLDQLQHAFNAERRREQARFELLQAELAELLRRVPAPDVTPASVTVTVH